MSDDKYTFDPESLSFEETDKKKGRKIIFSILTQFLAAIGIGLVVFMAISYTIKTPRQKKTERENEIMKEEYAKLIDRYHQAEIVLEDIKERDNDIYRAIFSTEPPKDDEFVLYKYFDENVTDLDIAEHFSNTTDSAISKINEEEINVNKLWNILLVNKDKLINIPSIMPLDNKQLNYLAYGYGKKLDPIYKTPQFHKGIDFAAPKGTEIKATAYGTVLFVGEKRDNGITIIIDHKNGYKTIFSHLSDYVVHQGQKVKRGETIGFVGNTGKSLTAHLHYEIQYNDRSINPIQFFFEDVDPVTYNALNNMANNGGLCLD
ncbi:MAG: M23 family metallopeptidase [Bacteroidales bacterium]|nr:M23 family metallopeptidase [Bacteroidales bacterium]